MPAYKIIGITDENTECDLCGRTELHNTIVFDLLDIDGNVTGELLYAGSTCATKLPDFRNFTAAIIRNAARVIQNIADRTTAESRQWAGDIMAKYGPVETAHTRLKSAVFYGYNPTMLGTGISAKAKIAEMIADAREILGGMPAEPTAEHARLAEMTAEFMGEVIAWNAGLAV